MWKKKYPVLDFLKVKYHTKKKKEKKKDNSLPSSQSKY